MGQSYADIAHERDELKCEIDMLRSIMDKMLEKGKRLEAENAVLKQNTAKEIFSLLLSDEYICYFDVAVVKEIAEKYGVEI